MPTPGRLMDKVAEVTGVNRSKVENIYDELRKSGDVPVGVRGRYGVNATSEVAAKLLIAVCCAEHVKDAAKAVRRYSELEAGGSRRHPLPTQNEMIMPGADWRVVANEFPRLRPLDHRHCFINVLVALIDSYIDDEGHSASVKVLFGSPYPWAEASVHLQQTQNAEWRTTVIYTTPQVSEDGIYEEDDPEFLTLIDPSKERQRRKFSALGGDLRVTAQITQNTLRALGKLLRE